MRKIEATEASLRSEMTLWLQNQGVFIWTPWNKTPSPFKNTSQGIASIMGLKDGKLLAIQCKALRQELTPEQAKFLARIREHGGVAFLARSFEEMLQRIEESKYFSTNSAPTEDREDQNHPLKRNSDNTKQSLKSPTNALA